MPVIPVRSHHSNGGKKITSPPITRSWGRLLDRAKVNAIKPREGITRNCTPSRSPIQLLRWITNILHSHGVTDYQIERNTLTTKSLT